MDDPESVGRVSEEAGLLTGQPIYLSFQPFYLRFQQGRIVVHTILFINQAVRCISILNIPKLLRTTCPDVDTITADPFRLTVNILSRHISQPHFRGDATASYQFRLAQNYTA